MHVTVTLMCSYMDTNFYDVNYVNFQYEVAPHIHTTECHLPQRTGTMIAILRTVQSDSQTLGGTRTHHSNLNGSYNPGRSSAKYMTCRAFSNHYVGLQRSEMKIRPHHSNQNGSYNPRSGAE